MDGHTILRASLRQALRTHSVGLMFFVKKQKMPWLDNGRKYHSMELELICMVFMHTTAD